MNREEKLNLIRNLNEYKATCIGKKAEKPIVVLGPAGESWGLRVYCYGGLIGELGTEDIEMIKGEDFKPGEYAKISKEYGKYLRRLNYDSRGHEYRLCAEMQEKYKDFLDVDKEQYETVKKKNGTQEKRLYVPGLQTDFEKMIEGRAADVWMKIAKGEDKYLDYAIAASDVRFCNSKDAGERKVQTKLIKEYMGKKKGETKYIITDMQYNIDNHMPDLILFDGESFGLVELKYAGKSMEKGSANSLSEHYNKFYKSIYKNDCTNNVKECLRRVKVLKEYGLIDNSWNIDDFKIPMNRKEAQSKMWMGFLFVEGEGKTKDDNIDAVKKKMEDQLKDRLKSIGEYSHADVMCCYIRDIKEPLNFIKIRNYNEML